MNLNNPRRLCHFKGCNIKPHKGYYCSLHKTAWQRKRANKQSKVTPLNSPDIPFENTHDNKINILDRISYNLFSVRTKNCLTHAGILTYQELLNMSQENLLSIPNFGKKCCTEIRDFISCHEFISNEGVNISLDLPNHRYRDRRAIGNQIIIHNSNMLNLKIGENIFSRRISNCLHEANINSIRQLLSKTEEELLSIPHFGKKCLKEIFELIPRIDDHISNQDTIGKKFNRNLNAFDILRCLFLSICPDFLPENELTKKYMKDIVRADSDIQEICRYFKDLTYYINDWTPNKELIFRNLIKNIDDRDFRIYQLRMVYGGKLMTLEDVGREVGLTRERVRQICGKIEKKLNRYIFKNQATSYFNKYLEILNSKGGILLIEDFLNYITKDDKFINYEILKLILGAYNYTSKNRISLIDIDGYEYAAKFEKNILDEAYGELLDEAENLLGLTRIQIREFLKLNETYSPEVEDICIDIFISKLGIFEEQKLIGIRNKTMLNLEYLLKGHLSGIHFDNLIQEYSDRFHNGEYQDRLRGYFDRSENILLWGRGIYIHRENIKVELEKIDILYEKIENAINNINNKTSVIHIFNENKPLMDLMNIPNGYGLYSILREQGNYQFVYRRFPDIEHIRNAKEERKKLFDEIEEYFLNTNRDLFWDELKSYFIDKRGLLPYQVTNTISHSQNIYRIGAGRWVHKAHLALADIDIKKILKNVHSHFNGCKYLILGNLLREIKLPDLSDSFHWNRTLLASILRKFTDQKVIANIAIVANECVDIKTTEDLVLDVVRNSNIKFTPTSLELYLRNNKITTNNNFMYEFISKYGYLLEN